MKRLVIAPAAERDLDEIARYIATDDPDRAASFVRELRRVARSAAERPASFPARDDIRPGLRVALHGRYRLFFRDLPGEIRIERVIHSARDLRQLFRH